MGSHARSGGRVSSAGAPNPTCRESGCADTDVAAVADGAPNPTVAANGAAVAVRCTATAGEPKSTSRASGSATASNAADGGRSATAHAAIRPITDAVSGYSSVGPVELISSSAATSSTSAAAT